MSSSVDGLVSGLSTSSLISSLMQVEAAPQDRLKAKVSTAQTAVSSYQSVNAKVAALETAAKGLRDLTTWRGIKATSTSPTVSATAVSSMSTMAGTTTFDVKNLAKSQITTSKVDPTAEITQADSITITIGPADVVDEYGNVTDNSSKRKDTVIDLRDAKDRTAKGVADAINAKGIGVKATVVTTGGAENILQFSGTKTGLDNAFTIGNFDPPTNTVAAAQNALLKIGGGEENGGYNVTSPTNSFTGLLTGVTVTVSKLEDNVTIEATSDIQGIADKISALVEAANAALGEIKTQTTYDAATKKGQPLTGDFSVRNMAQTILGTISQGVVYPNPDFDKNLPVDPVTNPETKSAGAYSQYGIELTRSGTLQFKPEKFKEAYAKDPGTMQTVGVEIGKVFETLANTQTKSLRSVIEGRKSEIDVYNTQISNWDIRLASKRTALQKHYSDLEVSLGKLKNQSNWLA
ncbi:MAG: flagellar filament capping protein FliD, partial [Actinoplanes sp.]